MIQEFIENFHWSGYSDNALAAIGIGSALLAIVVIMALAFREEES